MNKEIDTLGTVFGKGLGKSAFQERGNKRVLSLNISEELHWSSIILIPIPLSGLWDIKIDPQTIWKDPLGVWGIIDHWTTGLGQFHKEEGYKCPRQQAWMPRKAAAWPVVQHGPAWGASTAEPWRHHLSVLPRDTRRGSGEGFSPSQVPW